MTKKLTGPPFYCYGGKWVCAPKILSLFPPHVCYVELYCGAASLLFRKTPSRIEVINDLDGEIVNFFAVLRTKGNELMRLLEFTPYAREEYISATTCITDDPVEQARTFFVKTSQSFGGGVGSWAYNRTATWRNMAGNVSKWRNRIANFPHYISRLKLVQIEHQPALKLLPIYDAPTTLFYADPPYLPEVRKADKAYGAYEMSKGDHVQLLEAMQAIQGMALLSGYFHDLYDDVLPDWKRFDLPTTLSQAKGHRGEKRVECVWMNPWAYKVWTADRIRKGEIEWKQT